MIKHSVCTFVLVASMTAQASTLPPLSPAEVAAEAPLWVRARAQGVSVQSRSSREQSLEVLSVHRGRVGPGELRVRLPGGSQVWVPGAPSFEAGGEYMLLLRPSAQEEGVYEVVGLSAGLRRVEGDAAAKELLRKWQSGSGSSR